MMTELQTLTGRLIEHFLVLSAISLAHVGSRLAGRDRQRNPARYRTRAAP